MTRFRARAFDLIDRAEELFMAASLAFMTVLTFVQAVLRYLFDSGFVWSLEATTYTFGWLVLVGMSYGVRTRAHIATDILTRRLPANLARIVALTALVVSLVYCALMIFGSAVFIDRLMTLGNDARDIPLPRWVLTGIMPIAFALLAFRLLQVGWRYFRPARQGDERR
jgi:C4-dicarboxylate transporter DctQ subunit